MILVVFLFILLVIFVCRVGSENFSLSESEEELRYLQETLPIEFYYTDPVYVKHMKILLEKTRQILNKNGITHWAMFGTLLGIIRHKGFIPWDDDIDLGFLAADTQKLLALKEEFKKHNLNIYIKNLPSRALIKVEYIYKPQELKMGVWLDLFPYYYKKTDQCWHRVKGQYTKIPTDQLFPLTFSNFYGQSFPIPNRSEQILDAQYGKDWRTHAVLNLQHKITGEHFYTFNNAYNFKRLL